MDQRRGPGAGATGGFRVSLQVTRIVDRESWTTTVRRAEDLGYDMVVTADHLTECAPPLLALAAAAQVTTSLRLGTLVVNNDLRHLSVLAREAVALDLLSDGRFELGLGAGYAVEEYRRAGIRFDGDATRIARLSEAVGLLRRLLDGEVVTHAGPHHRLDGEAVRPGPVQARLPLLVGGGGRTTLALAGARADVVGLSGTGRDRRPDHVDRQIAWLRDAAVAAGRDPEVQILLHTTVVSTSLGSAARAAILSERVPDLTHDEATSSPYVLVGSPAQLAEELLARRRRWGIGHITVRADAMESFAPVIPLVRGTS